PALPSGTRLSGAMICGRMLGPLFLALLLGCARNAAPPVHLTLMSPHREEVREEFALGFQEWFRERSEARVGAARTALRAWLDQPRSDNLTAASGAFAVLFNDWRKDDVALLADALRGWQQNPGKDAALSLLGALDKWEQQLPPVQLIWQDIGGGTSQIIRYIGARFESNPEGIGIDILFGGGTDIFLRFADQGLLEAIEMPPSVLGKRIRPHLNGIPLYDSRGRWYGPILSSFGILYNREVLKRIGQPEPRHWADLG